jgi:hypothetical protein
MTCHDMEELLVGFAGDGLAPAQQEFVELHLEGCGTCRELVADLILTRRQLETLREDGYRPQLTERITGEIAARQLRTKAGRWLGRGARAAGGIAAAMLVGFAVAALIQGRLPLGRQHTIAGPAATEPAYLVVDGALVRVDAASGKARQVATLDPQAVMAQGGGRRFLLSNGFLTEVINLQSGEQRKLTVAPGARQLWASPDGRTVWLLRQADPENFALDAVDTDTGKVTADPSVKPGYIHAGSISQDGQQLYLLGVWQGNNYLKVVDLRERRLLKAHMLLGAPGAPISVAAGHSDRIYAVGTGWLLVVNPQGSEPGELLLVPGITPQAVLTPDGRSLIAARAGGGLLVVDPSNGRELRRVSGSAYYQRLFWSEDGRVLYAETDGTLEVRSEGRLQQIKSPISLSGLPSPSH